MSLSIGHDNGTKRPDGKMPERLDHPILRKDLHLPSQWTPRERGLDAIEGVVGEQTQVKARARSERSPSWPSRDDLANKPCLKKRDDEVLTIIHHDNGRLPLIVFTLRNRENEIGEPDRAALAGEKRAPLR